MGTERPKPPSHISQQTFVCQVCSRVIKGPAYFRHIKRCKSRPHHRTLQLYPIKLPLVLYRAFKELCRSRGQTLREGITLLIERELERQADATQGRYDEDD